jgi:aromatic-L-amino-acid decarboxylase
MADAPAPVSDLDWSPERAGELGRAAVAVWEELLRTIRDRPVSGRWSAEQVRAAVTRAIPELPVPTDELVASARSVLLEYSTLCGHPGFMAYISGAGTVPGAAADLLAAALNANAGGWRLAPAATEIEQHLTRWFASQFGLPTGSGGILVSGGAIANFVGLKAARDHRAGWPVRERGVSAGPPLAIYASEEVHHVCDRGADMLGLGADAVRKIPVDPGYRMIPALLEARIAEDTAAGIRPIAAVATAGTVATGAIDPIGEIAAICRRRGLWLHIDAAYGGPAAFVPDLRPLFSGIEQADSIAFDPHKWLYTPHSGGCVLFRDLGNAEASFSLAPDYIHEDKELTRRGIDALNLGPQFSRGFQAFKVWISLLAHGADAYRRRIRHDCELARYLGDRVIEHPDLELAAPVGLSIACFRYAPPDLPAGPERDGYLDRLNERLMAEIQLDGRSYCSNAVVKGRFVLRACIVNFRTEAEDCDRLLDAAVELGARLDREMRPEGLRARA